MMMPHKELELTQRELDAIDEENRGAPYQRVSRIADRAMEARINAALKDVEDLYDGTK